MIFCVTAGNMFNIIIIAAGIGICGMNILQVSTGAKLSKEATRYFQLFFGLVIVYIGSHLARQLMEGIPGQGIRIALITVTLLEFLASGMMAFLFSLLTLHVANPERQRKTFLRLFLGILIVHVLLMIVSQFTDLCYYFDRGNVYHRSPAYMLSNLAHLFMLGIDVFLLIRWRNNFSPRIRHAFWAYIIAPIAAIAIQAFFQDVQLIILATVAAAVYMSMVIMQDQREKYEQEHETATRMGAELSMATDIQASQLPRLFPAFPNRPEFDVFASMTPAKEVGGDFYDFFLIDDDHIGLVMADVSGKGVPAALFMMVARVLIKSHLQNGQRLLPGAVLVPEAKLRAEVPEPELGAAVPPGIGHPTGGVRDLPPAVPAETLLHGRLRGPVPPNEAEGQTGLKLQKQAILLHGAGDAALLQKEIELPLLPRPAEAALAAVQGEGPDPGGAEAEKHRLGT